MKAGDDEFAGTKLPTIEITSAVEQKTEPANLASRKHQTTCADSRYQDRVKKLYPLAKRMIVEFELDVSVPVLIIVHLRHHYGHYRNGRNGLGPIDEIAIDSGHVHSSEYWQIVATLLHECLHCWQHHQGTPPQHTNSNHHNSEFREKAEGMGLIVDQRGYTDLAEGNTPFRRFLREHNVDVPGWF